MSDVVCKYWKMKISCDSSTPIEYEECSIVKKLNGRIEQLERERSLLYREINETVRAVSGPNKENK